jgi:hypothetical protein
MAGGSAGMGGGTGYGIPGGGGNGGPGALAGGMAAGGPGGSPSGTGVPGVAAPPDSAAGSGQNSPGGARGKAPEGYVPGRPTEEQPMPRREIPAGTGPATPATPLRPGEWHPSEEYAPPPKHDDDPDDKNDKRRRKDVKSLAEKRGIDWGLRNAARGSFPITRPIRVECHVDRFVLPGGKIIPIDGPADRSIDKFISAVWEHMDMWGIAGQRMYWRPILEVYVLPGGEQRFEEMKRLLEGSGLTVERK